MVLHIRYTYAYYECWPGSMLCSSPYACDLYMHSHGPTLAVQQIGQEDYY